MVARIVRDGRSWLIGTSADVAWIDGFTAAGLTITSAIPPVFDAYATVVLPEHPGEQQAHDRAVIGLLSGQSPDCPWWLGYLDTGGADIVFPDAPKVSLYANWPYAMVRAGAQQAADWRHEHSCEKGRLPDLLFPDDRSWLVSTLWDDDWTCIGGPTALIERFLRHRDLQPRTHRVTLGEDATPPGRRAR